MEEMLILDGTEGTYYRRKIYCGQRDMMIQGVLFDILLQLAKARLNGEGWLSVTTLANLSDDNVTNRMREYIRRLRMATALPIETLHGGGMYRLNLDRVMIKIGSATN